MGTIKHIIFDFDGTLADTWPVMYMAVAGVFRRHDRREISIEDIYAVAGPTELQIIETHLRNREQVKAAVSEFLTDYEQHHDELVERSSAIAELLRTLREAGFGLALFTGKSRRTLDISLEKLRWETEFDHIITGDDVEKRKPSAEGIHRILDKLGWSREHTIFVGDSNDDMLAGQEAGMRTFAAQWMSIVQDKHYLVEPERIFSDIGAFQAFVLSQAQ
ncbi:HAD superfamily hydrolase (TIGR01549 family) [Paenibacillus endophyticus]|uniref:HAD superfamily hydrolase (TIGR01549 family) n=1 Tax=Paenibacillus endophyticus TaxID=1294268 RepID=A0A7W5C341_9BACL|nr:HAD family hydrolase [Paenibacillus endophyticus]MBB3150333.1 HAD superfamily hydrolase (TIGR01549 family) [Paenibacillus endophyticus]